MEHTLLKGNVRVESFAELDACFNEKDLSFDLSAKFI